MLYHRPPSANRQIQFDLARCILSTSTACCIRKSARKLAVLIVKWPRVLEVHLSGGSQTMERDFPNGGTFRLEVSCSS